MKTKVTIEQAYEIFATRIVCVCTGRGARVASDGAQVLNTPVDGLRVSVFKKWITCHFASPVGGYLATRRGCDGRVGKWLHYCPREVDAVASSYYVDQFAADLDKVLAFKPTADQLKQIMLDQREQHRHIKAMAPFFAMLPDMDEPTPEFIGPPTKLLRFGIDPAKPGKDKSVKARKAAKPKAKDAGRKRRGKVSGR